MVEDAGIIEAKIQLNIDDLKKGAMEANKAIKDLETELKKSKAEINNAFREGTRAVFEYGVELKNIELAEKTGSKTAQEASKARLDAAQKYLDVLIDVRNRIAEVNGENDKQVAVYDKLIKEQVKLRDSIRNSYEEAGISGDGFFAGIKRGFSQSGDNAKKFGAHLAKTLTPALLGLTAGIKAIQGIGTAIRDAFLSNEKFKEGIDNLKSALGESFASAVKPVSNFFAGIIENAARGIIEANRLKESLRRLREGVGSYGDTVSERTRTIIQDYETQKKRIEEVTAEIERQQKLGYGIDWYAEWQNELNKLNKTFPELEENYNNLIKEVGNAGADSEEIFEGIEKELMDVEKQISLLHDKNAIDDAEANQQRLSALNNYINAVSKLIAENGIAGSNINEGLDEHISRYNDLKNVIEENEKKELTTQEKITQARTAALEKYEQAVRRANDALSAGLIDQEEHTKQLAAARAQEYADLEAIVAQYKLTTGETIRIRDETAAIVKNNQDTLAALEEIKRKDEEAKALELLRSTILTAQLDALAEQAIEREREAGNIERVIELENELIDVQRKRERDAMEADDKFKRLQETNKEAAEELLELYDAVTRGMKKYYEDDTSVQIENARLEAVKQYDEASRKAHNDYARGLINEKELQDQLNAAAEAQYRALEDIAAEYGLIDGGIVDMADTMGGLVRASREYEKSIEAEEERKAIFIDQADTLAQQEITRAKEADLIDLAIDLENELIEKQRQRAKEALMKSDAYIRASKTEREEILKNFDAITAGMKKIQEVAKKTSLFDSEAFRTGIQIGEAAVSAFSDVASSMTEITRQQAEDAMAEIDRMLEEVNLKIEEERTHALEAAGFIEATTSESIQAQIDAAIEANDEILQYQLERRQQEMAINEEYDAKAKAAEEKAARDKTEIEYKAALQAWELQLSAALASLPLTIFNAIEAGWNAGKLIPIVGMAPALAATYGGLAGSAAGAQIAALSSAKPKMPKFATGGIVPGQPHANTDTVAAMLTPGEVILNRAQQENLVPQLGGDLYIDLIYNGEIVAKNVIEDYVNKGHVLIDASRGIR